MLTLGGVFILVYVAMEIMAIKNRLSRVVAMMGVVQQGIRSKVHLCGGDKSFLDDPLL